MVGDVVPAEADAWKSDPFAGVRDGDYVIGRGSLDAKGISIVHLLTLLELAERDTPLKRDIVFLATPDEQSGGVDGHDERADIGSLANAVTSLIEILEELDRLD